MEKENFSNIHYIIHNEKFILLEGFQGYCMSKEGKLFNIDNNSFEKPYKNTNKTGGTYHTYKLLQNGKITEVTINSLLKIQFEIKRKEDRLKIIKELLIFLNANYIRNFKRDNPIEINERFYGDRLSLLMELNKITLEDLAFELQITIETLTWYVRSLRKPNDSVLERIADFFKVSKSFFDQEEVKLSFDLQITNKQYKYTINDLLYNK